MGLEIKNGKHHTINIYISAFILCFTAFLLLSFSVFQAVKEKQWVIVIDPGHGGRDPGSLGSFTKEKNINLAIALKTGKYIQDNIRNVKVVYTRNDDSTVDLLERPKIANRNNADLFISIHANWAKSKSVMGTETFIMGPAKDQQNLEVAMKENEVIYLEDNYSTKYEGFDPKSEVSYIMFTVSQKIFQEQSTNLASMIQTQFREKIDRHDRDVKQAGFWVLFNTTMPSVLVETGFISNPTEEKFLNSAQGQDYIASAIYRACKEYINDVNSKSVTVVTLKPDSVSPAVTSEQGEKAINEGKIYFTVQVSASAAHKEITPESFKGLKDVFETGSQGRYKYASGRFTEYIEAVNHRKEIKKIYPDAFVIALKDGNIIPLQQALNQNKKR